MKVFDAHCDALLKLWEHPDLTFTEVDKRIHASLPELEKGNVQIQAFAMYVPERIHPHARFTTTLEMINLYYSKIKPVGYNLILSKDDLEKTVCDDEKGAILFVEGAGALEGSLENLHTLYHLGVRGMTLTWNFRNAVADGCQEPNPGGLSLFGCKVVDEMNKLGMMIDVSHVAEPGFWDTLERSSRPVIASHSNVKQLCNHVRNLTDQQIDALIQKDGVIGLSFIPYFNTSDNRTVWIDDLLRHLDYICARGGAEHVSFGSDFDGETLTFGDLTSARQYTLLVNSLLKRYKQEEVEKFVRGNWLRVFTKVLQ